MISCDMFIKKLNDFLEGTLSENTRREMEEHKSSCAKCSSIYNERKEAEKALQDALLGRDIRFSSSKDAILNSVDKKRYGKKPVKKLYFNFRRNAASYLMCAALLMICVFSYPYISNMINTGRTIPAEDTHQQADSFENNQKAPISFSETYLPLPENVDDIRALNVLNKVKDRDMGSDPWTICYSGNNRVIFYNSPGLIAYSYQNGIGEYYGAVDLEEIGCSYMSGETVTNIHPSPDGDSVVIWNWDVEALVDGNSNVYIYNFAGKKEKVLERQNKVDIVGSWSRSSRYYAFGYRNGKQIVVYDTQSGAVYEIPLGIDSLNQVFISDEGDIAAVSEKNYLFKKDGDGYAAEELNVSGDILGFTRSMGIAYFEKGVISEYKQGNNTILKEIGSSFRLANPYRLTGDRNMDHPVFSDGSSTIVYDLDKTFYTYGFGYNFDRYMVFSDDSKKCFMSADFIDAQVVTYDGRTVHITGGSGLSGSMVCSFLDNDSLIRIIQKDSSRKLGDFALVKDDLK